MEVILLKPILGKEIGDTITVSKARALKLMQAGYTKKNEAFMPKKEKAVEKAVSKKAANRSKAVKK